MGLGAGTKTLLFGLASSTIGLVSACRAEDTRGPGVYYCRIFPEAVQHACSHGADDPFQTVIAGSGAPDGLPVLSRTHAVFDIVLAEGDGTFGGEVVFLPARRGAHGIFTGSPVTLEARGDDGRPLRFVFGTSETHCAHFATAHVIELERDTPITLSVTSSGEPSVRVLFERLGSSAPPLLSTDCPDSGVSEPDAGDGDVTADGSAVRDAGPPDAPNHVSDSAPDSEPVMILDGGADVHVDGSMGEDAGDAGADATTGPSCRTEGPCTDDSECCDYCHDEDHCH